MLHRYPSVLTFSPDGNTVISGSGSQTAWLFDVATSKPRCQPLQHRGAVSAAVVSPDGRFAATVSTGRDHYVYLWDMATGHQIGPPIQHPSRINSVAFHSDGTRFVTAAEDGLVRIWDVPQAATGEVAHVRLRVETLTGMQLGEQGILQELDAATLAGRRQTLGAAGPEPFP
jgi:WD40 repeat protein